MAHAGLGQEFDDGLVSEVDHRKQIELTGFIVTDRTELDEQIEKVFKGVKEGIYRTKSGADLIANETLSSSIPNMLPHR